VGGGARRAMGGNDGMEAGPARAETGAARAHCAARAGCAVPGAGGVRRHKHRCGARHRVREARGSLQHAVGRGCGARVTRRRGRRVAARQPGLRRLAPGPARPAARPALGLLQRRRRLRRGLCRSRRGPGPRAAQAAAARVRRGPGPTRVPRIRVTSARGAGEARAAAGGGGVGWMWRRCL
jgi:hypothetical protein